MCPSTRTSFTGRAASCASQRRHHRLQLGSVAAATGSSLDVYQSAGRLTLTLLPELWNNKHTCAHAHTNRRRIFSCQNSSASLPLARVVSFGVLRTTGESSVQPRLFASTNQTKGKTNKTGKKSKNRKMFFHA